VAGAARGSARGVPRVRLVVLNFNGGETVLRCVEHLTRLTWPAEALDLVVVDNASTDGSIEAIEGRFAQVRTVRRPTNAGFPANNDALADLAVDHPGLDYVGLVNDDAFVTPGYLRPLVDALEADPSLGAACPRMLFEHRFVDLALEAPAARPGRGDPRELGVMVSGLRVGGEDGWRRAQVASGGHGPEVSAAGRHEWTSGRAVLRVPVDRRAAAATVRVEVRLSAVAPKRARLGEGSHAIEVEVGTEPAWFAVEVVGTPYDVVNNAGSVVFEDGYGADRGFGRPDGPAFDEPADVFAWCGGAVLLRPAALADVGLFEPRFFLYYEDTDLSWRGRARGWGARYVPEAVVHHLHAATSVEGSARFAYFTERNRLLMLVRNAPADLVRPAVQAYVRQTYDALRRDVGGALAQGRRPNPLPAWRRLRALAGLVRALPWALASRRRLRAAQSVPDAELVDQLTPRP
jgi:GT2 family glycosyltransferase